MKELFVCCKENGDIIVPIESIEEGRAIIAKYESEDIRNDEYTPHFYEIANIDRTDEHKWIYESIE